MAVRVHTPGAQPVDEEPDDVRDGDAGVVGRTANSAWVQLFVARPSWNLYGSKSATGISLGLTDAHPGAQLLSIRIWPAFHVAPGSDH